MCQLCENKQKLGEICLDCHKKLIMEEEKESRISTLEEIRKIVEKHRPCESDCGLDDHIMDYIEENTGDER